MIALLVCSLSLDLLISSTAMTFEQCCDMCTHGCENSTTTTCKCLDFNRQFLTKALRPIAPLTDVQNTATSHVEVNVQTTGLTIITTNVTSVHSRVTTPDVDSDDTIGSSGDAHDADNGTDYSFWCICNNKPCLLPNRCKYYGQQRCRCVFVGSDLHRQDETDVEELSEQADQPAEGDGQATDTCSRQRASCVYTVLLPLWIMFIALH